MSVEFVGIQLELMGEEGVYKDLKKIDSLINSLGGRKKVDAGFSDARKKVIAYRGELEKLKREQKSLEKGSDAWNEKASEIEKVKNKLRDAQQAVREFGYATKTAGKTFTQTFNSISSKVAHIGSAMQSLGNALTRFTSPFNRIMGGLLLGVGYKALNLITEGFSGAFERADVMKNYSRTLEAFGFSAKQAQASVEELNEAVLGLPTGLDEIVAAQKVYVGATNDLSKATGIAIAANNTFLASGMGSREQRFMQKYLVALGSGAKLTTTQWQSMARIAPLAMRAVAKELGYADKEYKQFNKDVQSGTISGEKFLDAFIKVGRYGSISDAANVMKQSWAGLSANITNAARRMGQGIIESINDVFTQQTGRNLLQTLLGVDANGKATGDGIKDWINGISESVQNWIKSHPEEILDFFNSLKSIDWKGFLKGIVEGMGEMAKVFKQLAEWASDKDLSKAGKWLVRLNMLGHGLTILGGVLKGLRGPIAFGGAGLALLFKGRLFKKLISLLGSGGLLGKLFGGMKVTGESAKAIPTISDTFKSAFSALEGLIKATGAVLIVSGTGAVAFKAVKSMIKDLKDIGDELKSMTWLDAVHGANIIMGIGVFIKIFEYIGKALEPQGLLYVAIAGAAGLIVGGALAGMMAEMKIAFDQMKQTILTVEDIANELSSFSAPNINVEAITRTIDQIDQVYAKLTGQGEQTTGSRLGRAFNFIRHPLRAIAGGVLGGASKAIKSREAASKYQSMLGAIRSLKKIASEINSFASITIAKGAVTNVHKVMDAVDSIIKQMPTLTQGGMQGPKNLLANTKSLANALYQMRRMAYSINKLAGMDVNTSGFSSFIQQLKEAMNSLKDVSGDLELDITVKLKDGFQESVNKVIQKIKKAKNDIKAQKKGISMKIPVSVTFSVTTNLGSAISKISSAISTLNKYRVKAESAGGGGVRHATGGMVYRAGGGSIPFKRRGTDTVPAMLTPGEYVQRKQAVNKFGIDFMRKVNNLDMRGAMHELMARAGGMAKVGRQTVVNNTYNNNQKATFNVNTNSPDFTNRLASRFVGAF